MSNDHYNGYSEEAIADALRPDKLELIILPTEKCNFRCTYCYEDFELGRMPRPVIDGIKNFLVRRCDSLEQLTISWFGGEPLLALDVINELGSFAHTEMERRGKNFSAGLTTNGYNLDLDAFSLLNRIHHTRFQITLDGTEETHDSTRRRADGKGTFKKIWENLIAIRESDMDFHVTLRMHVSRENVENIAKLAELVGVNFGSDPRFSVHFHRITNLGGANGALISSLPEVDYRRHIKKLGSALGLSYNSELTYVDNKEICYAAKANSLLIRSNGRLGKCTVALSDSRNDIGHITPDGLLHINNAKLQNWFNGYHDFDAQSLGCPFSNLGARLDRLRADRKIPITQIA